MPCNICYSGLYKSKSPFTSKALIYGRFIPESYQAVTSSRTRQVSALLSCFSLFFSTPCVDTECETHQPMNVLDAVVFKTV